MVGKGNVRSVRARYFVFVSLVYLLLGVVILVRGVLAHAVIAGVLGLIFLGLGAVRLRDYRTWKQRTP
jgi:hypothetical protein